MSEDKICGVQCSSEISEPKYARKTRIIRVCVYRHTRIDLYAYALISMYELAYCFFYCEKVIVDFNGHFKKGKNWWSSCLSVDRLVFISTVSC